MSRLIATLMIVTVLCGAAARADTYVVTPLGTLGGLNSVPTAINSTGVVTGWADPDIGGTAYAFTWTAPGPMQSLGTLPGGIASAGYSINDSGFVAGESDGQAVVYTPQNGMQAVGFLPGGNASELDSINDSNVAVGYTTTNSNSGANAIIWDPTNGLRDLNSMIVNPPAGWTPTAATVINQNGLIAGIGYANDGTSPPSGAEHAFTLSGGSLTVIPSPYPTGRGIFPKGMNSSGEVVGEFYDANEQEHAFVYTAAGGTRDLGNLGGDLATAFDVNDLGTIVGGSELPDGSFAAYLYTDAGGMVNLNTLAPVNGWTLDSAMAINDNGQIIAEGANSEGNGQAFLLTPTPEPSTFGLLIASACFILILQLCHRRLVKRFVMVMALRELLVWKFSGGRLVPASMIVTVLCGAGARADTMYNVQDLGTLAGPSGSCSPNGMNSYGQVTGDSDGPVAGTGLAFIWTSPGPMQSLGTLPGAVSSDGESINDAGWVCGNSDGEAFVYTPKNGMQGLGFLPGGTLSVAACVNNAGVVVGVSGTVGENYLNPFVWTAAGGMQDLNSTITNMPTGWTPTAARLINENGVIAGIGYPVLSTYPPSGTEHAFTLSGGSLTEIPSPSGNIQPEAINSSGEVVGFYGGSHAFEYTPAGGIRDISGLGGPFAAAEGVNDLGTIVGGCTLSDGGDVAFIYTDTGGMVNLSALVSLSDGFSLGAALAINDNGQILGVGGNAQGDYHAFLLTPTPEPSTFVLLITFACFLLILQLCRRRLARL